VAPIGGVFAQDGVFSRDRATCALKILPGLSQTSAIQFTVQSAIVEMSRTKIRLPEIDGAGHVALLATV